MKRAFLVRLCSIATERGLLQRASDIFFINFKGTLLPHSKLRQTLIKLSDLYPPKKKKLDIGSINFVLEI